MRPLKNWIEFFDLTDAACDEDEVKQPSDTVKGQECTANLYCKMANQEHGRLCLLMYI